jgi:hypothetical protein
MARLLRAESPVEFFKEHIEAALEHQHLDATDSTSWYLVNLLAGFISLEPESGGGDPFDDALGVRFLRAIEADLAHQRVEFRQIGDRALFFSGFFGDNLDARAIDIDYYVALGARSYAWLSQHERGWVSPIFAELASRFIAFVDVLSEVSERSALTSNADLLRLYEKWLRTPSPRNEQLLVEHGIVLPPDNSRVH